MNFQQYIRSLLPSFGKSRVLDDIRLLKEELDSHTLPPYENAAKVLGRRSRFQARDIQEFAKRFDKEVKTRTRGNFIVVIHETLKNTAQLLDTVEKLADKAYSNDIIAAGMSYYMANLLRYLETVSFVVRYSRKLLLWTYAAESNALENKVEEMGRELTKAEREWMQVHQEGFFRAITLLGKKPQELEQAFSEIPDMTIDPKTEDVVKRTVGLTRIDPLALGLIPIAFNPIYHIRMAVAEWQVSRYKAAQEEKRLLEFRLLRLKELEAGKPGDVKLQEQIEYNTARLEKLNFKLAKMEEKYG